MNTIILFPSKMMIVMSLSGALGGGILNVGSFKKKIMPNPVML